MKSKASTAALSCALGLIALLCAPLCDAGEGRKPIWQPTTITQPGHYMLTRDISTSVSPVVQIDSSNVVLDLNGRTITTSDVNLITIGTSVENVTIRNGVLDQALFTGVSISGENVVLERLTIRGTDVAISGSANAVSVLDCIIEAADDVAIDLDGVNNRFVGNTIRVPNRIIDTSCSSCIFRSNIVDGQGISGVSILGDGNLIEHNALSSWVQALYVSGAYNIIQHNTAIQTTDPLDSVFRLVGSHNRVLGNSFSGAFGSGEAVRIDGGHNVILDNEIAPQATSSTGTGLGISGDQNLIRDNAIQGFNDYGIRFLTGTGGNAYRGNMLRGNVTGTVENLGTGNTDEGGNIP